MQPMVLCSFCRSRLNGKVPIRFRYVAVQAGRHLHYKRICANCDTPQRQAQLSADGYKPFTLKPDAADA
jgi:hypothetical protein